MEFYRRLREVCESCSLIAPASITRTATTIDIDTIATADPMHPETPSTTAAVIAMPNIMFFPSILFLLDYYHANTMPTSVLFAFRTHSIRALSQYKKRMTNTHWCIRVRLGMERSLARLGI
jgi:hypothetical protein